MLVHMHRPTITVLAIVAALATGAAAQRHEADFRRSDPALLSKTGRPQLVEFYHPT